MTAPAPPAPPSDAHPRTADPDRADPDRLGTDLAGTGRARIAALGVLLAGAAALILAALPRATTPAPTPDPGLRLNPNTASPVELDLLPGIGPALAGAIVEHRETVGPFRALRDLDDVPQIGPRRLRDLEPHLVFEAPRRTTRDDTPATYPSP